MILDEAARPLIERVLAHANRPEHRCVSRLLGEHVDITVIREDRHRWSPCIQLEFREGADGTIVDGLVGPHPNVWTAFACGYMTVIAAAVFAFMLGWAQLILATSAWGMWVAGGCLVVVGALYIAARIGQRLGAEQTRKLRKLVDDALAATE